MTRNSRPRPLEKSSHGAAKIQAPTSDLDRSRVNWDYLRVFVTVAEAQSFRRAAAVLALDPTTVSRRIKMLEDSLGAPLLLTSSGGVHLTELGAEIFEKARDLAGVVADIERHRQVQGSDMAGRVRLHLTEGLGNFWVLPRLIEIQQRHPLLFFDAKCTMQLPIALSPNTDIAVQFERPRQTDVKTLRLGTLHAVPFASRGYVERFGIPKSLSELREHKIVSQSAEQGTGEDRFLKALKIRRPEGAISFRTESSTAQYQLVRSGAGIGFLATYAICVDRTLVPIEIDAAHASLDIWLVYYPQAKNVPRIAAAIGWLREIFDKRRFPWFRDRYIPASELADLPNMDWSVNMIDDGA